MNTNSPEWKSYIKQRNESLDLQLEFDGETYNYPSRLPPISDKLLVLRNDDGTEFRAKRVKPNGYSDDWCVITEGDQEVCGRWKWRYE